MHGKNLGVGIDKEKYSSPGDFRTGISRGGDLTPLNLNERDSRSSSDFRRSISRSIVDYDDLVLFARGLGCRSDRGQAPSELKFFVVGRNNKGKHLVANERLISNASRYLRSANERLN